MQVVVARPPMFAEIAAAFPVVKEKAGVIYAWGDRIYNPDGISIPVQLFAHEKVHRDRQGCAIEEWWRRYIADAQFRLDEELPAHVAEYRAFCAENAQGQRRNNRRIYLHQTAKRLASPLYGSLITYDAARKIIKASVKD